jgi:hypothetical protein
MTQTVLLRFSLFCGLFAIVFHIVDKRACALVVAIVGIVVLSIDMQNHIPMEDVWHHQPIYPRRQRDEASCPKRTLNAENRAFNTQFADVQYATNGTQTVVPEPQPPPATDATIDVVYDPDDRFYGEFVGNHTGPPRGVGERPPRPSCAATLPGMDRLQRIEPIKKNQHYHSQTGRLSRYAWLS